MSDLSLRSGEKRKLDFRTIRAPRLCENSEIQIARRNSVSISLILEISFTASVCQESGIENIFLLALGFRAFSHSLDPSQTSNSSMSEGRCAPNLAACSMVKC